MVTQTGTKLFTVGFDSGSMAVKIEPKQKKKEYLDSLLKIRKENPELFKKLESM
jgi:hypothetical protein